MLSEMKPMKLFVLACAVFAACPAAYALDIYNFHKLGFSKDGRYFAFAESVVQDGSGLASAEAYVVDVAANRLVGSKRVVLESHRATERQALVRAIKSLNPAKWGIGATPPLGEDLLVRTQQDRSRYEDTVFTTYYHHTYQLKVEATPVPGSSEERCFSGSDGELLRLTLESASPQEEELHLVLQSDVGLPKRRECASGYGISRVIRFGKSLVVIVGYQTPGFEGPNARFMAVTTRVELR